MWILISPETRLFLPGNTFLRDPFNRWPNPIGSTPLLILTLDAVIRRNNYFIDFVTKNTTLRVPDLWFTIIRGDRYIHEIKSDYTAPNVYSIFEVYAGNHHRFMKENSLWLDVSCESEIIDMIIVVN